MRIRLAAKVLSDTDRYNRAKCNDAWIKMQRYLDSKVAFAASILECGQKAARKKKAIGMRMRIKNNINQKIWITKRST